MNFYEVPIYFYKDKDTFWGMQWERIPGISCNTDVGFMKEITKQMKTEDKYGCIEEVV